MKRYILCALALVASLTLLGGCNSNNDNSGDNTKTTLPGYAAAKPVSDPSQISDAANLAVAVLKTDKQPDIPVSEQNKFRAVETHNCTNGGTMEFEIPSEIPSTQDMDNHDFSYPPAETVMSFHDCVEHGESVNGKMKILYGNDSKSPQSIVYLEDFTVVSPNERVQIKKGSTLTFKMLQNGWAEMLINADITYNDIRHVGKDLIYRGRRVPDGSTQEYPVSGFEQIGDSALFEVDPSYDASKTPFVTDTEGNTVSGKARYLDGKKHAVEIAVTDKNIVSVKVDQNGDGAFSEEETSLITLP